MYGNDTWKFGVVVILCPRNEIKGVIEENVNAGHPESEHLSVTGMAGLTLASDMSASRASGRYLMWVDTEPGFQCLGTLAHEAVHVAGMALADRGVDCDVAKSGSSECIAYLVEHIMEFSVDKLLELGIVCKGAAAHADSTHNP